MSIESIVVRLFLFATILLTLRYRYLISTKYESQKTSSYRIIKGIKLMPEACHAN